MLDKDPIVDEVRRAREAWAERFNFDIKAIAKDAEQRQSQGGRSLVRRAPRAVTSLPAVSDVDAQALELARSSNET